MVGSKPLVSIGLPVHNGEWYIGQALDCLLAQGYENFELIISDNASMDRTQEICLEYAAQDKRIRYYRNDVNMGAAWNYNRVFELSSGEYFMWAADDDYWEPGYIRSCLEVFNTSVSIVLAGAKCDLIDPEKKELMFTDKGFSTVGLDPRERFIRYKSTVHGGRHIGGIFYGIYKRSVLGKVMPMRNMLASDHLVLAELCFHGEFMTVQESLMVKRWGGASTSFKNTARVLGISNQLLIRFPYFVREVLLQRIIFQTDRLTLQEKIRLAGWSLSNYVILVLRLRYRALLALAARPAIRARELWRSAARGTSGPGMLTVVFRLLGNVIRWCTSARAKARIKKYLASGCKPWTPGYAEYKEKFLGEVLRDKDLLDSFRHNKTLPAQYGFRLDERVVEYPWVLGKLDAAERFLLDAGSALNFQYILDLPVLKSRSVIIYNLAPENTVKRSNVSYIYGDLRHTILDSECFDEIVCISTLEHVGMSNTFLYSKDPRFNEFRLDDYQHVVREFKRLLKPGGRLFITVPYGRYENLNWLQQFDHQKIKTVLDVFGGSASNVAYYKYFADGWQVADADACADCSYFDIHSRPDYEPDYVAAARSVACIEMVK